MRKATTTSSGRRLPSPKPADRPGWILRTAPGHAILQTLVRSGPSGHGPSGRLARHHTLALRRPGLHGERNPRREGDARWLVEPRFAGGGSSPAGKPYRVSRGRPGSQVPRTLDGKIAAVAVNRVQDFAVAGRARMRRRSAQAFEAMYADSVDSVLHGTGQETFEAVKMLKATDPAHYKPARARTIPTALSATT
jgi:hypothetical protein